MNDELPPVYDTAYKAGDLPKHLRTGPVTQLAAFPAPHRWATRGVFAERAWMDLIGAVTRPELWPGGGTTEAASYRLPAWTFARYRDDTRVVTRDEVLSARETRARVLSVHGLMVEYVDEPAIDADHVRRWWGDHAFIAHTTGFHELPMDARPAGPRWRVMVPFSRPVELGEAIIMAHWARHPRHDAGIINDRTEEVWRIVPVPAIGPGGYRWVAQNGPLLDPDAAMRELTAWQVLDTRVRADAALEGTSIDLAVERFVRRRRTPKLRPRFPAPVAALEARLGPLWPGRVVALVGSSGAGKSNLALQAANRAAQAGLPVLVVLTRMGGDEVVARLLAQHGRVRPSELLAGSGDIDAAVEALRASCPSLHLWAPPAKERDLDTLLLKVKALSDRHDGAPPLVVVDGVEGWGVEEPERGMRQLVSGLRDVSHAGSLGPDWAGAGVLLVGNLPGPRVDPGQLRTRWLAGELDLGPLEHDAAAIVVVATQGDQALAIVAKNRDGEAGEVAMRFDPVSGTFDDAQVQRETPGKG
jgi:hypothetical protein